MQSTYCLFVIFEDVGGQRRIVPYVVKCASNIIYTALFFYRTFFLLWFERVGVEMSGRLEKSGDVNWLRCWAKAEYSVL